MTDLTHAEFRHVWDRMTADERDAVRDKALWEHMSLWSVLNEWPSLIPRRLLSAARAE